MTVYTRTGTVMSQSAKIRHAKAAHAYIEMGVPEKLAHQMSALLLTRPALDMADLAASYKPDAVDLARLYAATNDKLGIYWLHVAAEDLKWKDRWQASEVFVQTVGVRHRLVLPARIRVSAPGEDKQGCAASGHAGIAVPSG